jgi:hypothetical protein
MSRVCTICAHQQRAEIDRAVLAGMVNRTIAHQFHITHYALLRHKADHLLPELVKAKQAEEVTQATDLLAMVTARDEKAMALLAKAEASGDLRAAGSILRVSLVSLELLARLRGQLDERAVVNLILVPEWVSFRTTLLQALLAYPEARAAAAQALLSAEGGQDHAALD